MTLIFLQYWASVSHDPLLCLSNGTYLSSVGKTRERMDMLYHLHLESGSADVSDPSSLFVRFLPLLERADFHSVMPDRFDS